MWSHGFVAEAIDRFCRTQELMDSSGERHRGVLTGDDMARWQPRVEAPVTYQYGRYTLLQRRLLEPGPGDAAAACAAQGFGLDGADPKSADFIHTVVECSKLAFADRDTFYGDPEFVKVPGETLLSEAYTAARRKLVGERASLEQRPGNIPGYGMSSISALQAVSASPRPAPASRRSAAALPGRTTTRSIRAWLRSTTPSSSAQA